MNVYEPAQEPRRQTNFNYQNHFWVLKDYSFDQTWYLLTCGELFHLGFSSKIELIRALWNMTQLFEYPVDDIPDFVEIMWDWIEEGDG